MAAKDNKKDKDIEALPEGKAEKPKKKSRLKRIVIILVILLTTLGAAAGGGYWWFFLREPGVEKENIQETIAQAPKENTVSQDSGSGQPSSATRIERQSDLPRSIGIVVPLPPITVNLAEPSGRRYLKLGMEIQVNTDVAEQIKQQNPRIRDAIIMLLAGKTYGDVSTPEGKADLKLEIASRINQILGAPRVVQVYFTDFVVE